MGLAVPQHVGSSSTRDQTCASCTGRWFFTTEPPGSADSYLKSSCFQRSMPGSSMDKGAWWATVCGVAKSQTQLSDWAHSYFIHRQFNTGNWLHWFLERTRKTKNKWQIKWKRNRSNSQSSEAISISCLESVMLDSLSCCCSHFGVHQVVLPQLWPELSKNHFLFPKC